MQFNAPVVVPNEVAGETVILRTGPIPAFEIETQAEDQGKEDERREHLAKMIPDDPSLEEVETKGAAQEKSMGDKPGRHPIELVEGAVACGCDRSLENLPGQPLEQNTLDHNEDEHDCGRARARPRPVRGYGVPAGHAEQRRERTVERLKGAGDPEDDRRGWSEENKEQRPQRRANKLDDRARTASSPAGQLLGR